MTELLSVQDLRKSYGGVAVLHGVNLTVRQGEILGLIGANGAGKSTLIDIITGLTPASAGEITLAGQSITRVPADGRAIRGLARTFQHPQVAKDLTLRENILAASAATELNTTGRALSRFFAGFFVSADEACADIDRLCQSLGLRDPDRLASEVTFGELRLTEFARAMRQSPKVIVLDEPFSGVGDAGIEGILAALKLLRAAGCAILLVDHNIDLITPLVDRMVLLAQGEILVEGDVQSCLASDLFRRTYIGVV